MTTDSASPRSTPNPAPEVVAWPLLGRILFRFAFAYLLLSIVSVSGALAMLPWIGPHLRDWIEIFWSYPVHWAAHTVFHLSSIAVAPHPAADSRDKALDWVLLATLIVTAMIACVAWSVVDRRRLEYRRAAVWLRFAVRLALLFLMFRYGLFKLFPMQMPLPSMAVLNEPVGNTSPLTLLWTLIGMHPAYEVLCGALETAAAVLLIFRRTALMGTLLTIVLLTNVLLYNLFFDVPVKLGALNLLVLAIALLAPDVPALCRFFWRQRPSALRSDWTPRLAGRRARRAIRVAELGFAALVLYGLLPQDVQQWRMEQASRRHPSPLAGEWRLDASTLDNSSWTRRPGAMARPLLTGEGQPASSIAFDTDGTVMIRSADGRLWRGFAIIDEKKQMLTLITTFSDDDLTYRISRPSVGHLLLTPVHGSGATLSLTEVAVPRAYPLLEHRMRWVNEWGYWM